MMEGQLIFCSDSILRFRSNYDETTALPLLSIQKTISDTDPFFLLRFFRHTVMIEEGTTLAEMEVIFISGLFFQTPRAAASCFEELKNSLDGLGNEVSKEAESNLADSGDGKPLKIEVADGAFDSLITHMESETENWQFIKKQCQKEGSLPVRIGVITPAKPPELRLCGVICRDSSGV
ncbi:hypothetical protein IAJ68_004420 [Salmonella enterica]|nr:hypothetical protein [Salmonella enterica]EGU1784272.1 hypothetical protein [Salmonella enterica]